MIETNEDRESQVVTQMANLKNRLSELEKSTTEIKDRLGPVLKMRVNVLVDSEEKTKKESELVPLARDIEASASRVSTLNAEIVDLLKVLEL